MVLRWFLVYAVVELAVIVALSSAIGFGWTVLLLLGTFLLGLALAGSQLKRQLRRLLERLDPPHGAAADSVLVALGTVLVVVPGLVTSALGVLLLGPPTRAAARPMVTKLLARRTPLITVPTGGGGRYAAGRGDYIDGEVISDYIDGEVIREVPVEPRPLPPGPA